MGWAQDSTEFGYALVHSEKGPNYFLRRTSPSGVAQPLRFQGSVLARAKRHGYQIVELEGQRLTPLVQAFIVGPGKTLRVVLEVGKRRLSYRMMLDNVMKPGEPIRLLRGYFKEVWTDIHATAYASPDKNWVCILLTLSTPFETKTWVDGVFVGDGRPKGPSTQP